jgi:hypothetical protein
MGLTNLWGSYFSRVEQGAAMVKPFRRGFWSSVGLNIGAPIHQASVTPVELRLQVAKLIDPSTLQ